MSETRLHQLMESALQEEYARYEQLLVLSEQQLSLLKEVDPDTDTIADLMNRKIELLKGIQELEIQQEPVRHQWNREFECFTLEERAEVSRLRDRSVHLIEQLHRLEQDIAKDIKRCEAEINRKLKSFHQGRIANQAYFSFERLPSRFIDKTK